MYLTRYLTPSGPRWGLDGYFLPSAFTLSLLLELRTEPGTALLASLRTDEPAHGTLVAPIEPLHEVWAAGVTYLRSRDARKAESSVADVYEKVYNSSRPEIFFKSIGWRTIGQGRAVRIRADSRWNVPEPEMVLVINRLREIIGYCAGNDMSSREIEGENPLYLPQAKIYNGSCALGSSIHVVSSEELGELAIGIELVRDGITVFAGESSTAQMHRKPQQLVDYLFDELVFPQGVFLMTGTCVVPGEEFSLKSGDAIRIRVGAALLENNVE